MSSPERQIINFISVCLNKGDPSASLLKNAMLYAFELDSPDDFMNYYKNTPHNKVQHDTEKTSR